MATHVGKILISPELFLEWLRFQGGQIRTIEWAGGKTSVEFVIAHPDMPLVNELEEIPAVTPNYIRFDNYRRESLI